MTAPPEPLSPLKRAFLALEQAQARVASLEQAATEPIAIIGLGCRVPGGGADSASFWQILRDGVDAIGRVPADRFDIDAFYDSDAEAPGKIAAREGGFLSGVDRFDAGFFGISPREAQGMDPQQRLLLEVCWEALEHAAQAPDRLEKTRSGVYVGSASSDYTYLQVQTLDRTLLDAHFASGIAHSVLSGRLSYLLGLQGPSLTIDTACSSSLVAVHLACQALRARECDLALAGGVNLILAPDLYIALSHSRMLAPDGRCKSFDTSADGFGRGEGCGIIVLKRLSDAAAAGDRVLAVIRGSAVNQDGPSSGLTAPNGPAQESVIREALERAGLSPAEVGLIEAHGTGTQLGDPLEMQALGAVFGGQRDPGAPLIVGSVKTNLGHLEAAAGVTGLIKLVLSLQHRMIPRHLHFKVPSPHIPWGELPFQVPMQTMPWERIRGRRIAGVSSFGFSGTNAHVIVEEAPTHEVVHAQARAAADRPREAQLFVLTARSRAALAALAAACERQLADADDAHLADICFTASAGRAHFSERATLIVHDIEELRGMLAVLAHGHSVPCLDVASVSRRDPPKVAFMFTGQGSQYVGMARGLYEGEPEFRSALESCARELDPHLPRPLLELLFDGGADALDATGVTQPVLFAVEYALARLWQRWGVVPSAVIGHSIGELVAACIAGVLDLPDALHLVARRGQLMQSLPPGGAMAAIALGEPEVGAEIRASHSDLSIAANNGPLQTVVSGTAAAVSQLCARLESRGVRCKALPVSHAFHSSLVEPILETFEAVADRLSFYRPQIRMISNLTGGIAEPESIARGRYWRDLVRAPVRFAEGLATLRALGIDCLLEIGPQPVLCGFAAAVFAADGPQAVASLRRDVPDREQMLAAAAALYRAGASLDWKTICGGQDRRAFDLPSYPFQRERYWFQAQPPRSLPRVAAGAHPLLGSRLRLAGERAIFEASAGADSPAFIRQHRVLGRVLMPATAYLELLVACARQVNGATPADIRNVRINEALLLEEDGRCVTLQTSVSAAGTSRDVVISSLASDAPEGAAWMTHVTAEIAAEPLPPEPDVDLDGLRRALPETIESASFYGDFETLGLNFGPAFHSVRRIFKSQTAALALVELDDAAAEQHSAYAIHPVLLDGCLQVIKALIGSGDALYLPVGLTRFTLRPGAQRQVWCHALIAEQTGDVRRADLAVYDGGGRLLARLDDVHLKRVSRDALGKLTHRWLDDALFAVRWSCAERLPQAVPGGLRPGARWLIVAESPVLGPQLSEQLLASGTNAQLVRDEAAVIEAEVSAGSVDVEGVVCLWALEHIGAVHDASIVRILQLAQALIRLPRPPRLWLVTRGAQSVPPLNGAIDPMQAGVWGLARTLRAAHPELRTACVDLDPQAGADESRRLAAELAAAGEEDEVAFRGAERLLSRLAPLVQDPPLPSEPSRWRLGAASEGSLDNFNRVDAPPRALQDGEVEIEVEAAALNFRDVLNVLGLYPGDAGPLGGECAGRIVRVGPRVVSLQVGDAVAAVAAGSFASHVVAHQELVQRRAPNMDAIEGASIPIAFLTADICLHEHARMRAGERVLIHAAAGGVGLAAVKLAQRAGAEVFATAGSPGKRALLQSLGVAHVFDSRSVEFERQIMTVTGGAGVDIVLNALSGEVLEPTFRVLRDGGRFIEIGKRGIKDAAWVERQGRSWQYDIVDWSETAAREPQRIGARFALLMQAFAAGELTPLPRHVFGLSDAARAFRFMSQARHVGKIVLRYQPRTPPAQPQGTYLITGGLSGLGLQAAQWLAERGAGRIVLVGRRGLTAEAAPVVARMRALAVRVEIYGLDVAEPAAVKTMLAELRRSGPPLRGILHCAALLEDAAVLQQTQETFARAFHAKVHAALLLDRLTRADALDWFVLFSSAAALLGSAGQANYAAANAVIDALAHTRKQAGLAALSINWGPWAEAGAAAGRGLLDALAAKGLAPLTTAQGFAALERLLDIGATQAAVMRIDWPRYLAAMAFGHVPALLREVSARADAGGALPRAAAAGAIDTTPLRTVLTEAPLLRRRTLLTNFVREQTMRALGWNTSRTLDSAAPLGELGLDSLLAVELRNTLSRALKATLPATLLFDYPSIDRVTEFLLAQVLRLEFSADADRASRASQPAPRAGLVDSIEAMSDDEVDRLIASRGRERA